jgi:hypothetical protein
VEYDNKLFYANKRNNYGGLPLFVPSLKDSTQFAIIYDRVSLNSLKAEISIQDYKIFRLTYTLDYNGYSTATVAYAWNKPTFVTGLDGMYRFSPKFFTEASLFYLSGRHTLRGDGLTAVKLHDHFDINLKLHYTIDDSWNLFLHINNAAYSKYYPFYNYPSFPIQVLAGAMFKF